jgi:hypothetical protein
MSGYDKKNENQIQNKNKMTEHIYFFDRSMRILIRWEKKKGGEEKIVVGALLPFHYRHTWPYKKVISTPYPSLQGRWC